MAKGKGYWALSIWFATDQDMATSLNYNEKLAKIRSIL